MEKLDKEFYSQFQRSRHGYMQINNKPLNSLKISNDGRIATGGDS